MLSLIRLDFSPSVGTFGLSVRLETLALAGVILLCLVITAVLAGRARARAERGAGEPGDRGLRRDDLILIAFGAIPGAIVGGRIGYGLIHLDYYLDHPTVLVDPGRGSLELTFAVLLGTLTALAVAALLTAPLESWLRVAAAPLLLGLGLGKLAMALGGSGQGQFSVESWATAYVGNGSWGSLSAATAALPSQILEGVAVLAGLAVLLAAPFAARLRLVPWRRIRRPAPAPAREWWLLQGRRLFVTALVLWAALRFVVAFSWRDATVLGPLRAEQLILLTVVAAGVALLTAQLAGERRRETAAGVAERPPVAAPEYPRDVAASEIQGAADQPRVEPAEPSTTRARAARGGRSRSGAG